MKNMKGGPGGKKKRIQNGPQNLRNGMESTGNGGCVDVYRLLMCACAGYVFHLSLTEGSMKQVQLSFLRTLLETEDTEVK